MALTIVVLTRHAAGAPTFDPGAKGGKLIIATEQPNELGRLTRSAPNANANLSIPLDEQAVLARMEAVLRPSYDAKDAALQTSEILSFDGLQLT